MLCSVLFLCQSSTIVLRILFSNPQYGMFRSGSVEGQASGSNERYLYSYSIFIAEMFEPKEELNEIFRKESWWKYVTSFKNVLF